MAAETAASGSVDYAKAGVIAISIIGAVVSIVMGAYTVGPAMGKVTSDSTTAISRNPDASGKIMVAMVVGMAMTESICIYTLVISLIVIYANPLLKYIFV